MDDLYRHLANGVTVLTASRRLAHALRIAYASHARAEGLLAWRTPVVLPWTVWLRQQWLDARARDEADRALRLLSPAQSRLLWEQIVAADEFAQELLNPAEAARVAQRSWRRSHEYLIDIERLREFPAPEAQALHSWAQQFIRRCDSLHAIDEARLADWAWDSGLLPTTPLTVLGFDTQVPALRRLVERWQAADSIRTISALRTAEDVRVIELLDREAEVEAAARWAREQVDGGKRNVAVIMSDLASRHDEVRRRFEEVFTPAARGIDSEAEIAPFIIAAPQPLAQFPLVDAALTVLHLIQGPNDSRTVGRLLRSPFLRGARSECDLRARADARLREEQRERWDAIELERWAAVTGCTLLESALRNVTRLARELPRRAAPSVWSERFHALLRAIGWPGERTLSSIEQQTLSKFQECLAELGSLDAVAGPMSFGQALRELGRLAIDTPFEAETPSAAVTIIDPATCAGMTFAALWVAGLDSTRLPGPLAPDPLLPLELQRAAGIPEASAESNFVLSRIRLQRLLASANEVVLSWPHSEGDAELQMSPLLRSLPQAAAPTFAVNPNWQHAIFAARPSLEVLADDYAPELQERIARGGARTLELQSLCAFRAQAELRLRAVPLKRVGSGLEPSDRGKLVHRVLASLWSELRDQAQLIAMARTTVEARVRELAQQHAAVALPGTSRPRATLAQLAVEQVTQQVMRLLAIDRQRPPFVVRRTERDESYTIGGLQLRLQPDRIDELAGGWLIVDYKLGAANEPKDWIDKVPGRPRKPQLPLYALAHRESLAGVAFAVLAPGAVEYRGVSNGTPMAPGIEPYESASRRWYGAPADWHDLLQRWHASLDSLGQRYVAGEALVDPLPDACTYCHLSTFCRVHERSEEAAAEASDEDV